MGPITFGREWDEISSGGIVMKVLEETHPSTVFMILQKQDSN